MYRQKERLFKRSRLRKKENHNKDYKPTEKYGGTGIPNTTYYPNAKLQQFRLRENGVKVHMNDIRGVP